MEHKKTVDAIAAIFRGVWVMRDFIIFILLSAED